MSEWAPKVNHFHIITLSIAGEKAVTNIDNLDNCHEMQRKYIKSTFILTEIRMIGKTKQLFPFTNNSAFNTSKTLGKWTTDLKDRTGLIRILHQIWYDLAHLYRKWKILQHTTLNTEGKRHYEFKSSTAVNIRYCLDLTYLQVIWIAADPFVNSRGKKGKW